MSLILLFFYKHMNFQEKGFAKIISKGHKFHKSNIYLIYPFIFYKNNKKILT